MMNEALALIKEGINIPLEAKREIYRRLYLFNTVLENQFECMFDKTEAEEFYNYLVSEASFRDIAFMELLYQIQTKEKEKHEFIRNHSYEWESALCYLIYGNEKEDSKISSKFLDKARECSLTYLKIEMEWLAHSF